MPRMLDVSEDVRAEIGDAEADRLLVGDSAPGHYDCTSCRTPGDSDQERTSTVLFVGEETAVLAFAHATCIPSQVVRVAEDQLKGAMQSITGTAPQPSGDAGSAAGVEGRVPEQAVLGITSGLVLIEDDLRPALVVEPTGPIARPGTDGRGGDQFLQLLLEQGFQPAHDLNRLPTTLPGWSVLLAVGRLHAVLQPGTGGGQVAWWQAHQPLQVTEGWRTAANKSQTVLVFCAPAGSIGQQPREDLLRDALDKAAVNGLLVAASMPLAGT
ncbi:hypothetical protein [Streptomyces nitrosporeus]|uniref:Uncharacterized protein n=1 Tax=Streptomyces nitrosporeus TaxID=28894 RepID=A0A5J6FGT4_9ACTN|nr:hypothetical protein [Streptomyces nitrosporeus]QEU75231.1 hypothetical protein CP967_27555 [Streptomyces nitrosporeus]GGZ19158.1 hypothetical protein GCM10010327_57870 [Streptomyces nitrosporeus]